MDAAGRHNGGLSDVLSEEDKEATWLHDLTIVSYRGIVEGPPSSSGQRGGLFPGPLCWSFLKARDSGGKAYLIPVPSQLAVDVATCLGQRLHPHSAVLIEATYEPV